MKVLLMIFAVGLCFLLPIKAVAATENIPEVPAYAQKYMAEDTESFAEGVWEIVRKGVSSVAPSIHEALRICMSVIGVVILVSCVQHASNTTSELVCLVGTVLIASLLVRSSNSMIHLGVRTVDEIQDYGNLLLPVMAGSLAAQGGVTSSAALYAGTMTFSAILSSAVSNLLSPLLYAFLVLVIAGAATNQSFVGRLRDFVKWLTTWGLKISLYVFTGYMGVTGVVSGSVDAAKIKAAKLTISGVVPVVGSILSDASESILVSAGLVKSSAGIYGLLAIGAIWIEPFLKIGIQYLLLKATAAVCETFGIKQINGLIKGFSACMGLVLAMTGAVCLMLLISVVCFMKGVS